MPLDPTGFRAIFPEFANEMAYPDVRISFYLNEAAQRLLPTVWGELLDTGTAYFVAHRLALRGIPDYMVGNLSVPPISTSPGVIASATEGSVSVSYDTDLGTIDGAGEFNMTVYGKQYASLMMTVAAGAMQF